MNISNFKNIDISSLTNEVSSLCVFEINEDSKNEFSIDDAAYFYAHENSFFASTKIPDKIPPAKADLKHWPLVKNEMYLFVCTEDHKYSELRKKMEDRSNQSLACISTYLAGKLGVEVGMISGFCSICLYFLVVINKNAFCERLIQNIKNQEAKKSEV